MPHVTVDVLRHWQRVPQQQRQGGMETCGVEFNFVVVIECLQEAR